MKGAENCVNAKINHVDFHSGCLVFEFEKYKGHKKGENHIGPWHVYANPSKCGCVQCYHYRGICFAILIYRRVMYHFLRENYSTQDMLRD